MMILIILLIKIIHSNVLLDISIGFNGHIIIILQDNRIYNYSPQSNNWIKLPSDPFSSGFLKCAVSPNGEILGVNTDHDLLYFNSTSYSWLKLSRLVSGVAFGNSNVYFLGNQGWTYSPGSYGYYFTFPGINSTEYKSTNNFSNFITLGRNESQYLVSLSTNQIMLVAFPLSSEIVLTNSIPNLGSNIYFQVSSGYIIYYASLNDYSIYQLDELGNWVLTSCEGNKSFDGSPYGNDKKITDFILCLYIYKIFF